MTLQYTVHESISLRSHPDFSEKWLHDRICEDPSILGLGELELIGRELSLQSGGRLDMLLADAENNVRYEVEIMLGATNPSHIIRCIEYWDIERRRYPAYDHVAVLVAEEVTSRFLNVMSLLAGSIPLVAIQLNALKVGEQVILNFVKVLDQRELRQDDTVENTGDEVDRSTWEARLGPKTLVVCDRLLEMANAHTETPFELKYKKRHIAVTKGGSFFNAIALFPRKNWTRLRAAVSDANVWKQRFEDAGLPANTVRRGGSVLVTIKSEDFATHGAIIEEFVKQAVFEFEQ